MDRRPGLGAAEVVASDARGLRGSLAVALFSLATLRHGGLRGPSFTFYSLV